MTEFAERRARRLAATGGEAGDAVKLYLKEIGQVPPLGAAGEVALAKRIQAGMAAEERLAEAETAGELDCIEPELRTQLEDTIADGLDAHGQLTQANLRLVVSIAKRYSNRGMQLLDLVQEGNIGLMRAVEKFDHSKGFKFSTYATWWIRQAITRSIADSARTIRLPVHIVEHLNKITRVQREMLQELSREPTTEEVAAKVDLEVERVREIQQMALDPLSINQPVGEEDDSQLGDFHPDESNESPDNVAARHLLNELVRDTLEQLSPREREVVRLRFGLDDGRTRTLEEVGKQFGVTRERIRQIEAKTLAKLRHPQRSQKLRDYLESG